VEILFANHGDERVGAIFLINFKNVSFYLAGCSDKQYQALGVNHFLQWHAINMLKRKGFKWYLLGELDPVTVKDKDKKIQFYESRFGGTVRSFEVATALYKPWKYFMFKRSKELVRFILPRR
jgi:Uncharacterized protein involved in methicillin resistance